MKTIQILLCLCLFVNGQNQAQSSKTTFTIQVNSAKIQEVTLSRYDFELGTTTELSSLHNLSPNEIYNVVDQISEPSIYTVKLNTGKEMRIAVEQNGPIHLQLDDEILLESNVAIESDFGEAIQKLNTKFFSSLINDYDKAIKENDQNAIAKLEKMKAEILVEFIAALENMVREMGPSALAFDALPYFDLHKNYEFLKEMTERFKAEYPNSGMSKSLQTRMSKATLVALGGEAPLFTAMGLEGTNVSLANFQGSYVLIDFWASWCRACRVENPKLVTIYDENEDKRFDIISVSIDSDITPWKKAIEKDGLTWNQILDTDQSIYKLYLLSSLPSNFLLNQEGKIIARNINSDQLKAQLDILLSKEIQNKGD